ncbi:hypothetical protein PVAP13_9KG043114 [Panicum virgatum]|uniref:Uncharacterized protein n=1 Tax=Panicum virgatum TaxID=38727 RepID=A0A8T0NR03_PANVG|nr:hypothetical protein PVAP13_9KG043114 [Panicum virgatum]
MLHIPNCNPPRPEKCNDDIPAHCQSELQDTWFALDSPMIHDKDGI